MKIEAGIGFQDLPIKIKDCDPFYANALKKAKSLGPEYFLTTRRWLAQNDLFYLLSRVCNRDDLHNQFCLDRCREVQKNPDGHIDLWAREHYKSSIVTFGLTLFDILNNPEITVGILSYSRPIAKTFLRNLKIEMEGNDELKELFPDILWANPKVESPKWSEDEGLIIKRKNNKKEATVEAWGLIDSQPTSKHFFLRVYDDVVTDKALTDGAMRKTTEAFKISDNIGARGGKMRILGTRYHDNDTYGVLIRESGVRVRLHPATKDGKPGGEPVLMSREELDDKLEIQGRYHFACQMLVNPTPEGFQTFNARWINYYTKAPPRSFMNIFLLVDPANSKSRRADYTAMMVVGLGRDKNYYLLDIVRDRFNLGERASKLFSLVRKWNPLKIGYESYGMQADAAHIKEKMENEQYRFRGKIVLMGGKLAKDDRIRSLVPLFESGRVYFPHHLHYVSLDGKQHDLVREFLEEEYLCFPVGGHDDMFDALARIQDKTLNAQFPLENMVEDLAFPNSLAPVSTYGGGAGSWMSM